MKRPRSNPPTWRNAPPVISGDVVIAAPVDSHDLIGVDLDTGAMLWSRDQAGLGTGKTPVDLLLGADRNTIYLGGSEVLALTSPIDLRSQPVEKWSTPVDSVRAYRYSPWPALARFFRPEPLSGPIGLTRLRGPRVGEACRWLDPVLGPLPGPIIWGPA